MGDFQYVALPIELPRRFNKARGFYTTGERKNLPQDHLTAD